MKTKNIFVISLLLFGLNAHSFAMDKLDNIINIVEGNKKDTASILVGHGRNKSPRTLHQLSVTLKSEAIYTVILPKGRNVEAINAME